MPMANRPPPDHEAARLIPVFPRPGPPILPGPTERVLFGAYVAWIVIAALSKAVSDELSPKRPERRPCGHRTNVARTRRERSM